MGGLKADVRSELDSSPDFQPRSGISLSANGRVGSCKCDPQKCVAPGCVAWRWWRACMFALGLTVVEALLQFLKLRSALRVSASLAPATCSGGELPEGTTSVSGASRACRTDRKPAKPGEHWAARLGHTWLRYFWQDGRHRLERGRHLWRRVLSRTSCLIR